MALSDTFFRSISETSSDAIISIDRDNSILTWNKTAEKMLGYTADEIIGEKIMTIIPERFREKHLNGVSNFLKTKTPRAMGIPLEVFALKKNGEEFPIELTLSCWNEGENYFFSGIIRDISGRKRNEARILASEQKHKAITETSSDAIISIDRDNSILTWNKTAEKMLGYTADEIIGEKIMTIIPERFRERHLNGVNNFLKTKTPRAMGVPLEVFALKKNGEEFPIELTLSCWNEGENYLFSGIIRDISIRKRNEARILASEQKHKAITETSSDAIISIDRDNSILTWNKTAEKMLGYTADEIIGKKIMTIIPERFRERHLNGVNNFLKTKTPRAMGVPLEVFALKKNGEEFPIELTLSCWNEGENYLFSGIIRDITERKKAEQEIKLKNQLLENEKEKIQKKNKELLDSIQYASRIQKTIITSNEYINTYLKKEYFIFYQPKHIVSGDFYWAHYVSSSENNNTANGVFYFATCDCTGHGVPGAFISLLNITLLNENVVQNKILTPGKILDAQREKLIKSLNTRENETLRDGMDCLISKIDTKNKKLEFAGANHSLWLLRLQKNKAHLNEESVYIENEKHVLYKLKTDKMHIGLHASSEKKFSNYEIDLFEDDILYMTTDGYTDQFGEEDRKKFMSKKFATTLLNAADFSMHKQHDTLVNTLNAWKGKLDQTDDILVVGIKI